MTKKLFNQLETDLKKYSKTYRLLGEYDKKHIEDPEVLANAGRLRKVIKELRTAPQS